MSELDEIYYRLAELERGQRNIVRFVEVDEVDAAKGTAQATDRGGGEGKDLPLPMLPWAEVGAPQAGGNGTTWRPPAKGQRMMVISPSGRLAEGMLFPASFSNAASQPSQKGDEHVETRGKTRVTWSDNSATIDHGGMTLVMAEGKVTITAPHIEMIGRIKIVGFIDHDGAMVSTKVHIDANGLHR